MKVEPSPSPGAAAGSSSASKAAKDMDVLHPDREILVGGRVLVVREYRFVEGLQILAKAKPIMDLLTQYGERSVVAGAGFTGVEQAFIEHTDLMIELVAKAADVEPEFVRDLDDADGHKLMQVWWLANQGFFLRRVIDRLAAAQAGRRLAGQESTAPSSAPASGEAQKTSAG